MSLIRAGSKLDDNNRITAIAIDRDKNSQFAVKWAVQNLLNNSSHTCILIHVRCQSLHPQDFDNVSKQGRPPTEQELQLFFLPYRGFCARKGVVAKEVILHDIDVPSALVDYVVNNSIGNIVVGASDRNALTRKFRNADVPSSLLKSLPSSCAVYVIAKGKVQTSRSASRPQTPSQVTPRKQIQQQFEFNLPPDSPKADSSRTTSSHGSWTSEGSDRISLDRGSDFIQRTPHGKSIFSDRNLTTSVDSHQSTELFNRSFLSENSDFSEPSSFRSTDASFEYFENSITSGSSLSSSSQNPEALESEMRRLRLELKQSMDMYNSVSKEAVAATQRARELEQLKMAKARRTEEAKLAEEAAWALAEAEKQKAKAAMETARVAQQLAVIEAQKRKNAEMHAKFEGEEKKKAIDAFAANSVRYRKYTIEEIEVGTNYFASSRKIGEGGYGPVYKGIINHIALAIKILRPDLSQGQQQFRQEVEVLSSVRHPNMVILLGACPEYGCLVYEYMDNGSLEDRLFQKDNTPPIPWKIRFKISAEIATALLFLHQTKPEPLVHRDLKPANILLDRNYVSKIGDVGLAKLVPASVADSVTQYHMTAAAGTFCYIDPEYQQTGMLGVKSDLYSLGVMLLQIITARPPMGLSHQVEQAIEHGTFAEILDPMVPDWPVEEALSFAKLALQCCELRKRDRPDLRTVILPELNRLRDLGLDNEAASNDKTLSRPPPRPYKSVPQMESRFARQINVRRGWQRLKSLSKVWSFKSNTRKAVTTSLPLAHLHVGKADKMQFEGCWSFAGCSVPPARSKRYKSFS